MTTKHLYLTLALVGLVVPYYFFISFVRAHGLDGPAFLRQLFGTPISSFFAADLLIASVVFVGFLLRESRRHSIAHWWVYLVALAMVGLSVALPLFLYARERGREAEIRTMRGSVA